MKGRQVRLVLAALVVVGLAGLVFRVLSSSEDEIVLSGLLPLEREFIDRVVIKSPDSEAVVEGRLIGSRKSWFVNATDPVFVPKIDQFWGAVDGVGQAGLIALNTANHERMGVDDASGIRVEFYLSGALQEQLVIGAWNPDVRLCYVRRAGQAAVYGIECPAPAASIFDPNPDGWRNPYVVAIPRQDIETLVFSYPDQEFALSLTDAGWKAVNPEEELDADPFVVETLLRNVEVIVAAGFAEDDEADELTFDAATPSIRVVTREGAANPPTRLRFLPRDEETYYVKSGSQPTVFIIDRRLAELLLVRQDAFGLGLAPESDETDG